MKKNSQVGPQSHLTKTKLSIILQPESIEREISSEQERKTKETELTFSESEGNFERSRKKQEKANSRKGGQKIDYCLKKSLKLDNDRSSILGEKIHISKYQNNRVGTVSEQITAICFLISALQRITRSL